MTIAESLFSLNSYPIPVNTVEKFCIDRELTSTDEYTKTIGDSEEYQLAMADVFLYLYTAPDLKEQQISINQADRNNYLNRANKIYGFYDDPKFSGIIYGLIGENFNG
jgi:hypothetical protein